MRQNVIISVNNILVVSQYREKRFSKGNLKGITIMQTLTEWVVAMTDYHLLQQLRDKLSNAKELAHLDEQTAREYCATWEEYDAIVAAR
jgi:hypothetical protein